MLNDDVMPTFIILRFNVRCLPADKAGSIFTSPFGKEYLPMGRTAH
jgi:hypothetical protein